MDPPAELVGGAAPAAAAQEGACEVIAGERTNSSPTTTTTATASSGSTSNRVVTRPRPPSTVLIVDPDPVSRRFVEIALGRKPDLRIEIASDGAGAIEVLAATRVHLVMAETDLPDMNGLQLFRRLIQETRLRGLPFVFLSADSRATTRRAAFAAGADDFLVKPCDGDVLQARIRSLIARERRAAADRQPRSYGLAGQLAELSFADLLTILEHGQRSGTISIDCDDMMGSAYLDEGQVVHGVFGNIVGPAAVSALMAATEGRFEFSPGPCPIEVERRTISESAQFLARGGARPPAARTVTAEYFVFSAEKALAEAPLAAPAEAPLEMPAPADVTVAAAATPALVPAFVPDAGAAAQLEHAIRDGFSLGDFMTFTDEDLERWTASTPARDRFHVLLVADLARGISAMLTLAGSPTEDWVLRSLSPRAKTVGLGFFLRRERLCDVVLVDIREPAQMRHSLRRVPSVVIVAPPAGDALAVGVKARVELADLIARLSPPAVLVLGNPILKKALRAPGGGPGTETAIRCLPTALGEPGMDLRAVLVEGIRLCAGDGR